MKRAICNITVILVVLFLLLFPYPVIADPAAVLSMSADTGSLTGTGGEFDLYVNVANVVNLNPVAFEISFDESVLEAIKNEKGYNITHNSALYVRTPDGLSNPFMFPNKSHPSRLDGFVYNVYQDDGGNTVYDALTVGETPVWLGKMRFKVLREAQTELVFTYHTLSSIDLTITPKPLPVPIPHIAPSLPLTFDFSPLLNVVSGTVSLEGRRYDGVMDGITVQVSGQETVVQADTGGNYELRGVAPGLVDLLFSRNGYLTECKQFNVPADPSAQVPPVILSAGDINGDGSVNKDDYALLKGKYLTADSVIDFDASGLVDLPDMVMLMRNLDLGS